MHPADDSPHAPLLESDYPTVVGLDSVIDRRLGGKAFGLAELARLGLRVPQSFVIAEARRDSLSPEIVRAYEDLGGDARHPRVAVRSSAVGEDGIAQSFAGQFDTVLDVVGVDELSQAIDTCVASAHSERASVYGDNGSPTRMNVVVQCMVEAAVAGVIFTADAASGRRDLMVIDAVEGLGEKLVNGQACADHYVLEHRDAQWVVVETELASASPLLTPAQLDQLRAEALRAVEHFNTPLDLEWAIDQAGQVIWLQARPITTLPGDLNELDSALPAAGNVFTKGNISEMMPGAACPLTLSITGYAMEFGLQQVQIAGGAQASFEDRWLQIGCFYGHFFLNMTAGTGLSSALLWNSTQQYALSACGREVPELVSQPMKPLGSRFRNTLRLAKFTLGIGHVVRKLDRRIAATIDLEPVDSDMHALAERVARDTEFYADAMAVHVRSSGRSALANDMFEKLVTRYAARHHIHDAEAQARAIALITGKHGVVGAELVNQIHALADSIAENPCAQEAFVDTSIQHALDWLREPDQVALSTKLDAFLAEHGHRGYRELCVRGPAWIDNPDDLTRILQSTVRARLMQRSPEMASAPSSSVAAVARPIAWPRHIRAAARFVKVGARGREHTKSSLVRVIHRLKRTLCRLGQELERTSVLPDADLIYFLTRHELPALISGAHPDLVAKAIDRRKAMPYQDRLEFSNVSVGMPRPLSRDWSDSVDDAILSGRVASGGVAEGKVRVALTIEDAAHLRSGEILVAPVTDVGWTPYFTLIAGLITDIGSALSHGAVIAREYGLPCIVNTRVATSVLHTGDWIRLDADTGLITKEPQR